MIHLPVSPVSRKGIISSNVKAINPHFDFIFSHPKRRSLFYSETLDGLLMWFGHWKSLFIHQQALICFAFHNILSRLFFSFFFGVKNRQLFNFQEVVYLSMVSWHSFISLRHTSYIQSDSFFITRSWRMFLSNGKFVDLFSLDLCCTLLNLRDLNTLNVCLKFLITF